MTWFTREQVAQHTTLDSLWVIHDGLVYDVSKFAFDHPGGASILLQHAGQDITLVMRDVLSHAHSDVAYDILREYKVGQLADHQPAPAGETRPSAQPAAQDDTFSPPKGYYTMDKEDPNQPFLDLNKPLFYQMWTCNFSKAFYLDQIHRARHLPEPARFFESPLMEPLSRTPWWVVPLLWVPVSCWFYKNSIEAYGGPAATALLLMGLVAWTMLEYSLHRFLFHLDKWLPDHPKALALHFLIHGVHHYLPMDRLRLVFPPALFVIVAVPVRYLFHLLLPSMLANGMWPGAMMGYIAYDMVHYYVHHARPLTQYMREAKKYHLAHHYKNPNLGFGITQKWWDRAFGTELILDS